MCICRKLKAMPSSKEQRKRVAALPGRFDWRNRDGVNYIPKVRNQGNMKLHNVSNLSNKCN